MELNCLKTNIDTIRQAEMKIPSNVYAIGDIHGKWQTIRNLYELNKDVFSSIRPNVLILLGDAGLNYFLNERDEKTKAQLGKYPFTYFAIRGNHEERPSILAEKYSDKWHTEIFWGNTVYVENDFPYIKYALDEVALYKIPYIQCDEENESLLSWNEYKTLVIPGAYSVDKQYRLQNGWSWFEGEQLTAAERERGLDLIHSLGNEVDLVLSHTCPIIFEPTDLFLSFIDQSQVDKTMERYLGNIEYQLQYNTWLWGHYHAYRQYPLVDGDGKRLMLYDDAAVEVCKYIEDTKGITFPFYFTRKDN